MLDAGAGPRDALVAAALALTERLAGLHLRAIAHLAQGPLALPTGVAAVGVDGRTRVASPDEPVEVPAVVLGGVGDHEPADELVAAIGIDGELVPEEAAAVLLRPVRLGVALAALVAVPGRRRCPLVEDLTVLAGEVLARRLDDGGVDDLPAARRVARAAQLALDGLEDHRLCTGLPQALLEVPHRGAVGDVR